MAGAVRRQRVRDSESPCASLFELLVALCCKICCFSLATEKYALITLLRFPLDINQSRFAPTAQDCLRDKTSVAE